MGSCLPAHPKTLLSPSRQLPMEDLTPTVLLWTVLVALGPSADQGLEEKMKQCRLVWSGCQPLALGLGDTVRLVAATTPS